MNNIESELILEMLKKIDFQIHTVDDLIQKFNDVKQDLLKEKQEIMSKIVVEKKV